MSCLRKSFFLPWYPKDILLYYLLKVLFFCLSHLSPVIHVESVCVCVCSEVATYFIPDYLCMEKKSFWLLGSVSRHIFCLLFVQTTFLYYYSFISSLDIWQDRSLQRPSSEMSWLFFFFFGFLAFNTYLLKLHKNTLEIWLELQWIYRLIQEDDIIVILSPCGHKHGASLCLFCSYLVSFNTDCNFLCKGVYPC